MSVFLKFNNSSKKYECNVKKYEDCIKVYFDEEYEANTSGFCIYSESGRMMGDYSDYTFIKESYADGFVFSKIKPIESSKEMPTLGKRLEEAAKRIEEQKEEITDLKKKLRCTNNALEELLFDYISEKGVETDV